MWHQHHIVTDFTCTLSKHDYLLTVTGIAGLVLIIGAQLPVARVVEGRRRARALALMACAFAACWLLVLVAGEEPSKELAGQIMAYCRDHLAPYKVPRAVEFRAGLPRSAVLKILRRELREEELAGMRRAVSDVLAICGQNVYPAPASAPSRISSKLWPICANATLP